MRFLAYLLSAVACGAAPLTFEWNPSLSSNVVAYRLYIATNGASGFVFTTTVTNYVWSNAVAGITYSAWVTALNTNTDPNVGQIESNPSSVIRFQMPYAPGTLKLTSMMITPVLEGSPKPEGPYTPIYDFGQFPVALSGDQQFYRISAEIQGP